MTLPEDPRSARTVSHVGVLVPWANSVVEDELPRWAGDQVTWHYARLVPVNEATALDDDFLAGLTVAVPDALHQLSKLSLERVYLACTSVGFTLPESVRTKTVDSRIEVLTAFDTITLWLRQLAARRVVLATPYPLLITERVVRALGVQGIDVLGYVNLDVADDYGSLQPHQVKVLVDSISPEALAEADAFILSCTAWPTRAVLPWLKRRLRIPVISSNLAITLHAVSAAQPASPRCVYDP